MERLALFVQRVSGVGLFVYLFFHIVVTGQITGGRQVWDATMATLENPIGHVGEILVIVAVGFHSVNGLRVVLLELTPLAGRPGRPDYPYKVQSLSEGQRGFLYAAAVFAGLSLLAGIAFIWLGVRT